MSAYCCKTWAELRRLLNTCSVFRFAPERYVFVKRAKN